MNDIVGLSVETAEPLNVNFGSLALFASARRHSAAARPFSAAFNPGLFATASASHLSSVINSAAPAIPANIAHANTTAAPAVNRPRLAVRLLLSNFIFFSIKFFLCFQFVFLSPVSPALKLIDKISIPQKKFPKFFSVGRFDYYNMRPHIRISQVVI